MSWYDIWAAVVAVNGMCVRSGKTGKAMGLGEPTWSDGTISGTGLTIAYR